MVEEGNEVGVGRHLQPLVAEFRRNVGELKKGVAVVERRGVERDPDHDFSFSDGSAVERGLRGVLDLNAGARGDGL